MNKYSALVDAVFALSKLMICMISFPISQSTCGLEDSSLKKHFTAKKTLLLIQKEKKKELCRRVKIVGSLNYNIRLNEG